MYSMPPTFDHRLYSIYGSILSLYHKLLVLAMAEVGTHDDLAAYEIQDVIGLEDATERGRGSFGAVYEVEVYGVPCVAKCLHDILIGYQQQFKGPMKLDEEGVDAIRSKFRDECTLHCQLRHPNIVQFLGIHYGMYSGELALIVERLQWDLGKFVEAYKEISESIKVSFLLDVAYGLMYLHNRTPSVIHRDLSAGNVLISGEGKAKIADLGASKIFQMSAFQAHTAGQPGAFAYMPPEALQPNPQYDQSFDIFSFGAVALYTATQKFPFAHEIAPSVREVQNGEIQIAKRRVAIEQAQNSCLLPLIKNCLFDNPQSRPSTSKLCIHLKQLASRNPRISGDFSKILGKEKDADIISLKEEVSKLQEQTRSQLEFREVQRQHILKMSADRAVLIEEYGSHVQSLTLKCDRSAESLQRGQEEIAHLKLEMVTLNKEKNEAVINQSQLQQELQKMQRTFDMERQDSASGRISLERELQELKDRNTALEHQLLEYAETISDLSKCPMSSHASIQVPHSPLLNIKHFESPPNKETTITSSSKLN
ncbi:uncharacterized protein LOC135349685 isoform X4 [Halichondria panicea]|uniref:uncharacterized protein LOC135349685 isoform X4 n=1 Tax=Halichondria panicea TaxID=6063 RepID=UPI00312B91FD